MNIKEYLDILKDLWTPTNASKIRMAINNALEMMGNNLKENIDRQDNVESQFKDVIDNTTDKDVISAPEIITARNGEANLKARLDKEHQQTHSKFSELHQTMNTSYVDKPIMVIESDDGLIEDYNILRPFLSARNVPATIAIPTNRTPGGTPTSMGWEQIRELVDVYGWSVTSHTHTNKRFGSQTPSVSAEVIDYELRESKRVLEEQGFEADHFTYVGGEYNDLSTEIAKKYYKSAATTDRHPVNERQVNTAELTRDSLGLDMQHLKADIDRIVHFNSMLIVFTHGFSLDEATLNKLGEVIDYAKSKGVTFMNRSDALKAKGNIIDVGVPGKTHNLQITGSGNINQNGESINSLSPEVRLVSRNLTLDDSRFVISDLKGYPKSVFLEASDTGNSIMWSRGYASYNEGQPQQFSRGRRLNDGVVTGVDYAMVLASDNANQYRCKIGFGRYTKSLYIDFEKRGNGIPNTTATIHLFIEY